VGFNNIYLKPSYYINVIHDINAIMPYVGDGGNKNIHAGPQPPPLNLLVIKKQINVWLENCAGLIEGIIFKPVLF